MDAHLIEKITRLVMAKLEEEKKTISDCSKTEWERVPLSDKELMQWERITNSLMYMDDSNQQTIGFEPLSEEEIRKWKQLSSRLNIETKSKVTFRSYY